MPKIALWGGFKIGVPINDPKVPPLEIVKVPPCISYIEIFPSLPFLARSAIPFINLYILVIINGIWGYDNFSRQAPLNL